MASRSHVDVNERRLRPIYDCLDNGNNKKAVQEADKVLKKQKDLQCAKILKALALLRLGRHDDSSNLLDEVHAQHPVDEATLQAMCICYRETYKLEAIVDMYENAHKLKPDNEEILSALFMAYVRMGNYKKQQQTAMSLHRLQPQKNPYYFWAIMSIVMQSHTDKRLAATMFLPLADRMTKKYVEEGKINAEAEVQLYLIILELMGKYEETLNLLKGPLGEKLTSELLYQETREAELYTMLERWPEANAAYKRLIKEYPDHWINWQNYISSCIKLESTDWTPLENDDSYSEVHYTSEMALTFIQEILTWQADNRLLRGPYLARLELIKVLRQTGSNKSISVSPLPLMIEYYELFGDKFCCVEDLTIFTDLLSEQEGQQLIDTLSETLDMCKTCDITFASNVKQMQRHVTICKLKRHLGIFHRQPIEHRLVLTKEFLSRHQHGLDFGKDLLATDVQFSDSYLLLAVHLLVDIWEETEDTKYLWQGIVQLEKGMKKSISNFQIKVLLMRLYCIMGVYGPCHTLYESLEVKHIMNDTLGHTIFNHIGRLGHFMAACATYGSMLKFFAVNHKETAEYLIASYKYGSFNKINEFVKFRNRLQNSIQYISAQVESMLLDMGMETAKHQKTELMVSYMALAPDKERTPYEDLCDNRDLSLMRAWACPVKCNIKEAEEYSFKEEKAWIQVRDLSLRILGACVILGQHSVGNINNRNGVDHEKVRPMNEVLEDLIKQFKDHLTNIQDFSKPYKYPTQGPYPTKLSCYLSDNHSQIFTQMVDTVVYVYKLQEEGFDSKDGEQEEKLKSCVPNILEGLLSKHRCSLVQSDNDKKCVNPKVLENLVFLAETLSHVVILTGVCHRILKPLKSSFNKKSKKKKDAAPVAMPSIFENYNHHLTSLETVAKDLHQAVLDIDPVFLSIDLSNLSLTEPLTVDEEDAAIEKDMWKKVEKSYQVSAWEVTEFLHNKMQYLNDLKL
ncbi:N-alpha-acetyltransferase 25, NatB auxiliary subunit-like [Mytilus californianus]|uniref:N-alpha-acetyltransferase 25, NatB auxiliary subunit-like n=1 Tax=Mytilus californianus TaxID=6549 RepID=UPI0022480A57|nr:N-alpha-acetyltransferase 25, NatB auxiliary subunit-like [Mytilus californianus]